MAGAFLMAGIYQKPIRPLPTKKISPRHNPNNRPAPCDDWCHSWGSHGYSGRRAICKKCGKKV